jgi:hypothetical protein
MLSVNNSSGLVSLIILVLLVVVLLKYFTKKSVVVVEPDYWRGWWGWEDEQVSDLSLKHRILGDTRLNNNNNITYSIGEGFTTGSCC